MSLEVQYVVTSHLRMEKAVATTSFCHNPRGSILDTARGDYLVMENKNRPRMIPRSIYFYPHFDRTRIRVYHKRSLFFHSHHPLLSRGSAKMKIDKDIAERIFDEVLTSYFGAYPNFRETFLIYALDDNPKKGGIDIKCQSVRKLHVDLSVNDKPWFSCNRDDLIFPHRGGLVNQANEEIESLLRANTMRGNGTMLVL